jgi:hypothetical protein
MTEAESMLWKTFEGIGLINLNQNLNVNVVYIEVLQEFMLNSNTVHLK